MGPINTCPFKGDLKLVPGWQVWCDRKTMKKTFSIDDPVFSKGFAYCVVKIPKKYRNNIRKLRRFAKRAEREIIRREGIKT